MADGNQDINNGPTQSRVVLAKPRLGGFGSSSFGASNSSKPNTSIGSVLRPPQLKPIQGNNPFLRISAGSDTKDKSEEIPKESVLGTTDERLPETNNEDNKTPKFVPLQSTNVSSRSNNPVPAPAQPTSSTQSSGFVFGQNLSERVMMKESVNNGEASMSDHSSSNGTTELLFTSAAASVMENNQEEAGPSESGSGEGLAAAAAEYERSHARPLPPTTNCTMTGEEGEINIIQLSCRLFAWETGSWRERGRGVLRLNDAAPGGGGDTSRLVARVAGSLRVMLNTKLWPEMVVERAGAKSLRITAMDAQQQVKLFLIMGAPTGVAQLNRALLSRIAISKRSLRTHTQEATERLESPSKEADKDFAGRYDEIQKHSEGLDSKEMDETDNVQNSERLDVNVQEKTDAEDGSLIDDSSDLTNENKSLKRKDPRVDEDTSPKRQCPKIFIE